MNKYQSTYLNASIEYLKGVGPARAEVLKKELQVFTIGDLLFHYPFRYVDKTQFHLIKDIKTEGETVQVKGKLISMELIQGKKQKRLSALFKGSSGFLELVWFKGIKWIRESLQEGGEYVVYGKVNIYGGKKSIPHPEIEPLSKVLAKKANVYEPVYHSTEKLNLRGLDNKARGKLILNIFEKLNESEIPENLPDYLRQKLKLCSRAQSIRWIHMPSTEIERKAATDRIKFEELFFLQLRLIQSNQLRKKTVPGAVFSKVGNFFNRFYSEKLPFTLTGAQKRVVKEIRADLGSGVQMNRLLQGDVGSGKTMVGLMSMLLAIDNGYQTCMMAPTEILARQHYTSLLDYLSGLGVNTAFLSGTVKGKKRKELLKMLADGKIDILVGTHALIEDPVIFKNLGLAIIDEQHRFGVAQRSKLYDKNKRLTPHVLVMTATPIPRTLAMTYYGDLDVSVIDELPPGRKDIKTIHKRENYRPRLIQFMHQEIAKGRQIYVVFPLIEESAKLELENLTDGYDRLLEFFPRPDFQLSMVHGRMKAADKEAEMQRFVEGKTQIMVATTVIEVGVNVPNASVMIIENTERFGLSQLHQLRGRVGRGAEQSYCILMSSHKISKVGLERIGTMVRTNNGFEIAEADLKLRGAGDISGTQQSGAVDFNLVNLLTDQKILEVSRSIALKILDKDPELSAPINKNLSSYMKHVYRVRRDWAMIS